MLLIVAFFIALFLVSSYYCSIMMLGFLYYPRVPCCGIWALFEPVDVNNGKSPQQEARMNVYSGVINDCSRLFQAEEVETAQTIVHFEIYLSVDSADAHTSHQEESTDRWHSWMARASDLDKPLLYILSSKRTKTVPGLTNTVELVEACFCY